MAESKANTSVKIFEKWRRRSVADEITVCWICNRDLASPRSLLCLHSFCEECILVLLKTYERRGKLERAFRCPQCKTLVPNYIPEKVSRKSKARFHVVVTTQIKKDRGLLNRKAQCKLLVFRMLIRVLTST